MGEWTQCLSGEVELVGDMCVVALAVVFVATGEAEAELQAVKVEFETANIVFFHACGINCRIVIVVVVECSF